MFELMDVKIINHKYIIRQLQANVEGLFKVVAKMESLIHHCGITIDDCFAHLELAFLFYSLMNVMHGMLGQTYRDDYISGVKMSARPCMLRKASSVPTTAP